MPSSDNNSQTNNTSRPMPIHHLKRDLRSAPDEAEPSYSYEQESFLAQKEDEVEDAFHRKNNIHFHRRDSAGSTGSSSRQQQHHHQHHNHQQQQLVDEHEDNAAAAATNGSFWRMEALQKQQQQLQQQNQANQSPALKSAVIDSGSGGSVGGNTPLSARGGGRRSSANSVSGSASNLGLLGGSGKKLRKSNSSADGRGSLLGAALDAVRTSATSLASRSNESLNSKGGEAFNSSKKSNFQYSTNAISPDMANPTAASNVGRNNSSTAPSSFQNKKKTSKQRQAERRYKLESQSEHDLLSMANTEDAGSETPTKLPPSGTTTTSLSSSAAVVAANVVAETDISTMTPSQNDSYAESPVPATPASPPLSAMVPGTTASRGQSESAASSSSVNAQQHRMYHQQHPARGHSESAVPSNHGNTNNHMTPTAGPLSSEASPDLADGNYGDTGSAAFGWSNNNNSHVI